MRRTQEAKSPVCPLSTDFMTPMFSSRRLFWTLVACSCAVSSQSQVEFRAIGGPGLEQGEVVVPHATGAFLVGISKLPESEVVRGYIAHFDADLEHDWSTLLPHGDPLELVVDAWESEPGVASILTQRLDVADGYQATIHRVDSTGAWLGSFEPIVQGGFRPSKHVDWVGSSWIVGTRSGHPTAYNIDEETWLNWGNEPGAYDQIHDADIRNNQLIAVGTRTRVDTMFTAIWGVYPLGQLAFEHVALANDSALWSRADAVAVSPELTMVLQTYSVEDEASSTPHVVHNLLSVNNFNGENGVISPLWGPNVGQEPGRDLISSPLGVIKLTVSDEWFEPALSFQLTHVTDFSAFVSHAVWGTPFEEDPSRLSVGDDGSIWVAGSTRGTLDGSWNACLLRLDSLGPLAPWYHETAGFGVTLDPLFGTLTSMQELNQPENWRVSPNPASDWMVLHPPSSHEGRFTWRIVGTNGQTLTEGEGTTIPLWALPQGSHFIQIETDFRRVTLPFVVTR